ncbi:MAG: ABC transporter ATP-binding protein, partial [Roseiarcus sp.]
RRALETLPRRIEELRADLDAFERKLADADFAVREPSAFLDATKTYAELRDALAGAEDEWLGLEILREELERQ